MWDFLDVLFPAMEFRMRGDHWESTHHLSGERDSKGQFTTYVYPDTPFLAFEHGRGLPPRRLMWLLIDLTEDVSTYMQAVQYIAAKTGVSAPDLPEQEGEAAARNKAIEEAEKAFVEALFHEDSEGAKAVREYLVKERKWGIHEIKCSGVGYVSEEADAKFKVGANGRPLAIPLRQGGFVRGFKFRSIQEGGRYKNEGGAKKGAALFGIPYRVRGGKVIVTESELDAVLANARNEAAPKYGRKKLQDFPPVVASCGGDVTDNFAKDAAARGVHTFILALDTDDAGIGYVTKSATHIAAVGGTTYVVDLSPYLAENEKDLGDYFKTHTLEEWGELVANAQSYARWRLSRTLSSLKDKPTDQERSAAANQCIEVFADTAVNGYEREWAKSEVRKAEGKLGVSVETLISLAAQRDNEKAYADALQEAADKAANGDKKGAKKALDKAEAVKYCNPAEEFADVADVRKSEDFKAAVAAEPDGLATPYFFFNTKGEGEPLIIPRRQLTFIGARSSHGKSRFCENLALHFAFTETEEDRQAKASGGVIPKILYFSYEEVGTSVEQQMLNVYADTPLGRNNLRTISSLYKGETHYVGWEHQGADLDAFRQREKEYFACMDSGRFRVFEETWDVDKLCRYIRYRASQCPLKAVFIDYVQLLYPAPETKAGTRKEELTDVCAKLAKTAKETGTAIIMGAQLNREPSDPLSMDTRHIADASDIEHIANVIVLLWNSTKPALIRDGGRGYLNADGCINTRNIMAVWIDKVRAFGLHTGTEEEEPTGAHIYANLAKNRGGVSGLTAVFGFNGNTGRITAEPTLGNDADGYPRISSIKEAAIVRDNAVAQEKARKAGKKRVDPFKDTIEDETDRPF